MTTVLLVAIAVLLALILVVLVYGLTQEQRAKVLKFLLLAGVGLGVLLCVAVGESTWFRRDYENALGGNIVFLLVAGCVAALCVMKWFSRQWWLWSPSEWRVARLLRKINRGCAPPLKFLAAKTVYIENPDLTSEVEGAAYLELKKWGRFEVVADRTKADLILSLSTKPPGADLSDLLGDGLEQHDRDFIREASKFSTLGLSFLKVSEPERTGTLYETHTVWQRHPRSATRDLIRKLRKTIREAEKWYEGK